ncbi:LPS O-antigen chain length determinant protein WzzB [Pseudomonas wadenswilerensis]|uniref:LPS O-antigen chain length determinant protein WzzB n=1 Tax=Pseudomonas wadenswilerensis TaxID=1785161 RepID=UPI000F930203|nr:Wzz/FepE/Etk N-terminal domain-containing protein [Pseudomonas wadenswilerensis]UVM20613.1 Wzz/FepE/Etk N-terminal domain-containing protein [Pseudomonas wadenswilerensis]
MQSRSDRVAREGDIDLFDLAHWLWLKKVLIVSMMLLGGACGVAYAILVTPIYEAKGVVIPPTQNGIAELNYGRTSESGLAPFNISAVYDVFLRNLRSETLRRRFFEEQYLPSLDAKSKQRSEADLYRDFSRTLQITLIDKSVPDRYSVQVQSSDPALAARWASLFIEQAGAQAKAELISNVEREAEVLARNLSRQINMLRETGRKVREDLIIQLNEALAVAQAIGLHKPPLISGNLSSEVSAGMDGELTYMRGTNALEAEIRNLKERKSDDPFIHSLRDLQSKYDFYKYLEVDSEAVSVFRFDGPTSQPDIPVKPKRVMAVAGGAALGLVVGVLIAMFGYLLGRRSREATVGT